MANNEQQINEIQKKLGQVTFKQSIAWLQDAFKNIARKQVSYGGLKDIFITNGLKDIPLRQLDTTYYLTDWVSWQSLFENLLINQAKYYADKYDCENFAYTVSSLASLVMCLNTCGRGYGTIYDKDSGAKIALHYFNVIPTIDGKIYVYDAIRDGSTLIEKGKPIIIKDWKFDLIDVSLF